MSSEQTTALVIIWALITQCIHTLFIWKQYENQEKIKKILIAHDKKIDKLTARVDLLEATSSDDAKELFSGLSHLIGNGDNEKVSIDVNKKKRG